MRENMSVELSQILINFGERVPNPYIVPCHEILERDIGGRLGDVLSQGTLGDVLRHVGKFKDGYLLFGNFWGISGHLWTIVDFWGRLGMIGCIWVRLGTLWYIWGRIGTLAGCLGTFRDGLEHIEMFRDNWGH